MPHITGNEYPQLTWFYNAIARAKNEGYKAQEMLFAVGEGFTFDTWDGIYFNRQRDVPEEQVTNVMICNIPVIVDTQLNYGDVELRVLKPLLKWSGERAEAREGL